MIKNKIRSHWLIHSLLVFCVDVRKVFLDRLYWDRIHMIYLLYIVVVHQRQGCQSKICMEHIDFIPWSIRDSSSVSVLTSEYIILEGLKIDPVLSINHKASR